MNQLQFGGMVPFTDRRTGQPVQVRVWGVYVGQGVDAHEEQAIQQWIMNALATSAASYEGNIYELPAKAQEWGSWVSQQIAPGLAQAFQAHGQLHIQGVQIEGQGAPAKAAAPMAGAAMAGGAMGAMGAMGGGGGNADVAARALMQQLGMPQDQAYRATQVVMSALGLGGAAAAAPAMDPYAAKAQKMGQPDPYAAKAQKMGQPDPYAQKGAAPDPYAAKAQKMGQPDPYAQKGAAPDPYAQKAQKMGQPDPYAQKGAAPDPYAQKGAAPDPYAQKGDPYKKG
ncbi:MAG: hypothetical protein KF729_21745 [Sandaracinaceae bacterium]|nr:hypothetical protein [Sandaracinaceae bacterium]